MYNKTIIEFGFCEIRSRRPRLITLASTLILPDITETSSKLLFIIIIIIIIAIIIYYMHLLLLLLLLLLYVYNYCIQYVKSSVIIMT